MKIKDILFFGFVFLVLINLNLGHSVTPSYLNALHFKDEYFGYMFAAMSLGHLIFAPIWGNIGDKIGRKKVIMIGFAGYAISQYIFASTAIVPLILFVRFTAGACGNAIITSSIAYVSQNSGKKNRTNNLSIFAGISAGGGSAAYVIGGNLEKLLHVRGTLIFQALMAAFMFFLVFFLFNNSKPESNKHRKSIIGNLHELSKVKNNQVFIMFLVLVLVTIAHTNIGKFLDKYLIDQGYTPAELGNFVGVAGFVGILSSFFIVPLLVKKFRDIDLLVFSLFLSPIIIVLTFIIPNLSGALYSVFMFFMILKVVYDPLDQTFLSEHAEANFGTVMGIRWSFRSIGNVIAPLLGGFLYALSPLFVFFFSSLLMVAASIILFFVVRKNIITNR